MNTFMNKGLRFIALLGVLTLTFLLPSPKPAHAAGTCETFNGRPCHTTSAVHCFWSTGSQATCFCLNSVWMCSPGPS